MLLKMGAKSFQLVYDFNSMCLIEEAMGMSVLRLISNKENIGFTAVRAFLYAGLYKKYEIDLEECGDMIQEYIKNNPNNFGKLYGILTNAMKQDGVLNEDNKGPTEKKSYSHLKKK